MSWAEGNISQVKLCTSCDTSYLYITGRIFFPFCSVTPDTRSSRSKDFLWLLVFVKMLWSSILLVELFRFLIAETNEYHTDVFLVSIKTSILTCIRWSWGFWYSSNEYRSINFIWEKISYFLELSDWNTLLESSARQNKQLRFSSYIQFSSLSEKHNRRLFNKVILKFVYEDVLSLSCALLLSTIGIHLQRHILSIERHAHSVRNFG